MSRTPQQIFESYVHAGALTRNAAALAEQFTEDGVFELPLMPPGAALPRRMVGREEIRDAMAYFRLAVSPDDGLAFERIVNTPKRGLGPSTIQLIHSHARKRDIPLMAAAGELALTEENPTIKPYDEAAWATLADTARTPVGVSLTLLPGSTSRVTPAAGRSCRPSSRPCRFPRW